MTTYRASAAALRGALLTRPDSAPDLARFQVEIGFVDGDPTTAHVRHSPAAEVVDSVSTGFGA